MPNASKIVDSVLKNLQGRGGFYGFWDSVDEDIQEEIVEELTEVVQKELGDEKS
jgi:alcohol dehydrogenase class IV